MNSIKQLQEIDEQLLSDLTAEESEQASGGFGYYTLGNKSGIDVNYTLSGKSFTLKPNETRTSFHWYAPTVVFDRKIGAGYELTYQTLTNHNQNFDRYAYPYHDYLALTGGNGQPNANLVPSASA